MRQSSIAAVRSVVRTKTGRLGAIALLLLLAYGVLGAWVIPWWGRGLAERRLSSLVGGRVAIDSVSFQPFAWRLRVDGFRLHAPDGTFLLGWSNLLVDAQVSSLWRREVFLRAFELEGWDVRVSRDAQGNLNLLQLGQRVASQLPPSPERITPSEGSQQDALPAVTLGRWSLAGGRIEIEDLVPPGGVRWRLEAIDLGGTNLTTRPKQTSHAKFSARGDGGESLEWEGDLGVAERSLEGIFRLQGFGLARVHPYIDAVSPVLVTNGVLGLEFPHRVGGGGSELDASVHDMSLTIRDFAAVERVNGEPFAGAQTLELRSVRGSLREKSLGVGALRIEGAWLEARRRPGASSEGGETNLRGIVEPHVIDELVAGLTDWQLALDRVEMEGGRVGFSDSWVRPPVATQVEAIQILGEGLSNGTNAGPFKLQTSLRWGKEGAIRTVGEVRFFPARARVGLELDGVALEVAAPYLAEFVHLSLNRAMLSARLQATYGRQSSNQPIVGLTGNLAVKDLAATETGSGSDFIRWDEVALKGLAIGLTPHDIALEELLVRRLQTSLVMMTNGQLNVLALIRQTRELAEHEAGDPPASGRKVQETPDQQPDADAGSPASSQAQSAPFWETWPVRLGKVRLEEVALFATDEWFGGGFRTQIESLDGEVRHLGLPASQPAEVDLKGRLSATSGFDLNGTIRPEPGHFSTDLQLLTRNADLTQFTPYTLRFAGYPVTGGNLTADVRYQVDGMKLEATNKLVLSGLNLGAKTESPDAVDLPLKLGIALLKDSDGKITLDLPLTGTLNDPQFRVAPILWQAVRTILLKAVTAPFKMLGSLFGGSGDEELEFLEFEPGQTEIPMTQSNRLATLKRALAARPQLTLAIVPSFDARKDTRALAMARLEARLRSMRVEEIGASGAPLPDTASVVLSSEDRTRLIRVAYQRDLGALPDPASTTTAPALSAASPAGAGAATNAPPTSATNAVTGLMSSPVLDPLQERLLELSAVPVQSLMDLAKRRGEAVLQVLVADGGLGPDRVTLETASQPSVGDGAPQVRFRLE
jgi:hypothetical protein